MFKRGNILSNITATLPQNGKKPLLNTLRPLPGPTRRGGRKEHLGISVVAGLVPATSRLYSNICDSYGIVLR